MRCETLVSCELCMSRFQFVTLSIILSSARLFAATERVPLSPWTPSVSEVKTITSWSFDKPEAAWPALNQCTATTADGSMRINASGDDSYLSIPVSPLRGPVELQWEQKGSAQGPAEIFWFLADKENDHGIASSVRVSTINDGQWHSYRAVVPLAAAIKSLRVDPCTSPGIVEVRHAKLLQHVAHPLQFTELSVEGTAIHGTIKNITANPVRFTFAGKRAELAAGASVAVETTAPHGKPFEAVTLTADIENFGALKRTVYLHHSDLSGDTCDIGNSSILIKASRDGSGASVLWKGQLAAIISPLAVNGDGALVLKVTKENNGIVFSGDSVKRLSIHVERDEVLMEFEADQTITGPVIRALGDVEQGLLAGVEHLGKKEASSSTLDVERTEAIRFEPDPMLLTMPLAAYVTERASVAMLWDKPDAQPVFCTPNRYDGTPDHLMAVKGKKISLRVRLGDGFSNGGRLEDAILWAVKICGLPILPKAPRTADEQRALNLAAFNGPLKTPEGWLHAVGHSAPQWFGDHASSLWRLTGEVPKTPKLVPGGAHIANPAAFLVTGRAAEWLVHINASAESTRRDQQPDGSFRYSGKYQRGHFEDTASGWCAQRAFVLLDHAQLTGNADSLAAGLRALEFMRRFRTPRGAQTWEMPLHTPDLYAVGFLVRAYVRGFQLTGNKDYLMLARRWALSGVPFIYLWGNQPTMPYASIGVLGATEWRGVVWIGLPVQWCGTTYAYALTELSQHDETLDWWHIAEGILLCSEQMQYPDGPHLGCLPDSFNLPSQRRLPADVNPCVLIGLRERINGNLDALAVAQTDKHLVVSPYPVKIEGDSAIITAKAGTKYQIIINGKRLVNVESFGEDEVSLPAE